MSNEELDATDRLVWEQLVRERDAVCDQRSSLLATNYDLRKERDRLIDELQGLKMDIGVKDTQFWVDRRVTTEGYPASEAAFGSVKEYILYLEEELEGT
jgi:hypothetical protein